MSLIVGEVQAAEKAHLGATIERGVVNDTANVPSIENSQHESFNEKVRPDSQDYVEDHEPHEDIVEEREIRNDLEAAPSSASIGPSYSVFGKHMKRYIIFMSAFAGFFSPLSANIYLPALNPIAKDLHVSSSAITLTLTTYMIFQGLAPSITGDLADMSGRRPVYIIGFIIYIGACIGIALQDSFAALLVLRCIQSSGSSSFVALGSGIAADVSTPAERGAYMGWTASGMLLGPAIGPIIGGLLSQFLGWRAIFWFLVILAGAFLIPFILTFPETGRNVVGNGSIPPQPYNQSVINYLTAKKAAKLAARPGLARIESTPSVRLAREELAKRRKLKWPNPFKTLKVVVEKDISLLLLYNSLVYTAFYDVTASQSYLFGQIYGYNDLQVGLSFIPFGVGSFIAPMMNGWILDRQFKRVADKAGIVLQKGKSNAMRGFPLEKARIPVAIPLVLVGDACLLAYGWVMQAETSVAVPLVLQFIMGLTLTGSFNVMNVMLVDNYPMSPATATAANNLCRCLMGAGGTAVIIYMIDGMGRGWCYTFIGLIVLATTPILLVLMKWGPHWREERFRKAEEVARRVEGSR